MKRHAVLLMSQLILEIFVSVLVSMYICTNVLLLVVIDTNSWFHATFIHPGNVSITFGAEFE